MVDALRKLDEVLVPGGIVVDTQPVSARPAVFAAGRRIGSLDMHEWVRTIESVDAQIERTLRDGRFALEAEQRMMVTDSFHSGEEFLDEVRDWAGTDVPRALEEKVRAAAAPVTLEQEVRLRVLAKPAYRRTP